MVQGLKFLSKKGFHPQNKNNQKRVWEAEQQRQTEDQRIREREAQLKREREDEEMAQVRGDAPKLNFLYAVPPGMEKEKTKPATEQQPGDDAAAAAFRRMLAGEEEEEEDPGVRGGPKSRFETAAFGSTVLQGSTAERDDKKKDAVQSALEKAVGRRKDGGNLTLEDQIERFPALANAPRAKGMTATDVGVKFNPLGTQIRNIKCLACGIWGHSRGDRECTKTGWDPFASASRHIDSTMNDEERNKEASSERDRNTNRSDNDSEDSHRRRRRRKKHSRHDYSDDSASSSDESSSRERRRRHKRHKKSKKRHRKSESPSRGHHRSSRRSRDEKKSR